MSAIEVSVSAILFASVFWCADRYRNGGHGVWLTAAMLAALFLSAIVLEYWRR